MNSASTMHKELLKYVITLCLAIAAMVVLYVAASWIGVNTGAILPANYNEQQAIQMERTLKSVSRVTEDMMPEGTMYALLSKSSKKMLYGTMQEQDLETVRSILDGRSVLFYGQKVYRIIEREEDYCVLQYYLRPQFRSSYLRSHLPAYETTSLIALIVFIIAAVLALTARFASKLKRQLVHLSTMTGYLKNQNLDFEPSYSSIKEFNDAILSLLEMRDALRSSLETQWKLQKTKKEQIGALAHDLKIPVTIIKGNSGLLGLTDLNKEQETYTEYIQDAVGKIEQHIELLIQMARSEDILSVQKSRIPLGPFVNSLMKEAEAYGRSKAEPVAVVLQSGSMLAEAVELDHRLLHRALMNILSNAVDFSPGGGTVRLTIDCSKEWLSFTVLDSGPGFSSEGLASATDLFYMADKSRSSQGHYGMGLTFSHNVAKLHHGKLTVANQKLEAGGEVILQIPTC